MSVFYAFFVALEVEVKVEKSMNRACIDMAVMLEDKCYLLKFKVVEGEGKGKAIGRA